MQRPLEPEHLARVISSETGLEFEASTGVDDEGQQWYLLRPRGLLSDHTFSIRTTLGWRRLRIDFEPGTFAGPLLVDMSNADTDGRSAFLAILSDCHRLGARIDLNINSKSFPFDSDEIWALTWNRLILSIKKGQLDLGTEDGESDTDIICSWTGRLVAATTAILPTEEVSEKINAEIIGYPEGALTTIQTNRYERNRRNRAAAIAIHGTACQACGIEMKSRYGSIATGMIEIHHTTPVSELGEDYVIDPVSDLIPLCPNCHAVAHRRTPPLSINELQKLLTES